MNFKIVILLIIFVSETTANAPSCFYEKKMFLNFYGYGCEVSTNNAELTVLDDIYGTHDEESDGDVIILTINLKSSNYFEIFPSIFCEKFENLLVIDMSGANISAVIMDAFKKCPKLRFIKFSKNKIPQIYENIFDNNVNLVDIQLSQNKFVSLPEGLFKKQNKLSFLDLSRNSLDDLPNGIFQSQVKLRTLKLNSNEIGILKEKWFKNLHYLQDLDLSSNKISELPENIFKNLKSLTTLTINLNLIVIINSNSFGQHPRLKTVSMNFNPIFAIDEKFIINNSIKALYLKENECGKGAVFTTKQSMIVNLKECFDNFEKEREDIFFPPPPLDLQSTPTPTKPTKKRGTIPTTTLETTTTIVTTTQAPTTTTTEQTTSTTTTRLIRSSTTESSTSTTSDPDFQEACKKSSTGIGLVVNGDDFDPGTYPWMAVLIDNNDDVHCGGVLISSRKVLTAGHCIVMSTNKELKENDLKVILGSHFLASTHEVSRVVIEIEKIHVHENWNPGTRKFEFDIAVIILKENVDFNDKIRPICLAHRNSPAFLDTNGTVVGYGKTEDNSKKYSKIPKRAQAPIHDFQTCIRKHPQLQPIAAQTTFCGGHGNGTGACTGDSGGGLFVAYKNVYYLRGIVSSSLRDSDLGCNVNAYALYTDVTQFIKWIDDIHVSNVTSRGEFIKPWSPKPITRPTLRTRTPTPMIFNDKPVW